MATSIKERRRHLAAWRSCGLNSAAYCTKNGIPSSRMEYWVRRERRLQATDGQVQQQPGFVEVTKQDMAVSKMTSLPVNCVTTADDHLILRFPSGHELQLPINATPTAVAELTDLVCRC